MKIDLPTGETYYIAFKHLTFHPRSKYPRSCRVALLRKVGDAYNEISPSGKYVELATAYSYFADPKIYVRETARKRAFAKLMAKAGFDRPSRRKFWQAYFGRSARTAKAAGVTAAPRALAVGERLDDQGFGWGEDYGHGV